MCPDDPQLFSLGRPDACTPYRPELPKGELLYYPTIGLDNHTALFSQLERDTPWEQKNITLFGNTHRQPRKEAWYGDEGANYAYSGLQLRPLPWTPLLAALRAAISRFCDEQFNSVLLNYYADGRHYMGLHADDEPELGRHPVIASLSLGAERRMYFRPKRQHTAETTSIDLAAGSLLLMRGPTQENWKHGIRKSMRIHEPRINLTFRNVRIT